MIDEGKKIYDGSLSSLKETYGTKRKVTMEIRQPEKVEALQLPKLLNVREEECTVSYEKEKSTLSVMFDKHKIQIPQLLSAVMSVMEVKDVQIQETELAQIVKEIYSHGVTEG